MAGPLTVTLTITLPRVPRRVKWFMTRYPGPSTAEDRHGRYVRRWFQKTNLHYGSIARYLDKRIRRMERR